MDDDFEVVINGETYALSNARKKAYQKYWHSRQHAKERGISFSFSFTEWLNWWKQYDFKNFGPKKDQLSMVRIDKSKGFEPGNVFPGRVVDRLAGHQKLFNPNRAFVGKKPERKVYKNARKIITPDGVYNSITEAAFVHNLSHHGAEYRAKNKIFGWSFAENDPNIGP